MEEALTGRSYESLSAWRHCIARIETSWASFLTCREDRLRHGGESEKVAEAVLEDLFTGVLDWSKGDLTYQVEYADIVLSHNLAKYLVIEVKRPGTLFPGRRALDSALEQARRYADEQHIPQIAASDGRYLYAADIEGGGLRDRVFVDLAHSTPPLALWWLSVHGIYRPCEDSSPVIAVVQEPAAVAVEEALTELLHPKYQLPACCFAYVGNANNPSTWKLPYLLSDGKPDGKRLPKAIQALLSNFRGVKVAGIPEQAIPDVLRRLAQAAAAQGKLPPLAVNPAPAYQALADVLEQQGISL